MAGTKQELLKKMFDNEVDRKKYEIRRNDTIFKLERLKAKGYIGEYNAEEDSLEDLLAELERLLEYRRMLRS